MENKKSELIIISIDEIETKEVNWLWYPYIPYGKITIIQGDPGEGKTTFALRLAALLSNGGKLPCTDSETKVINIIYQTVEDGYEDTIKPRLKVAGADCKRIMFIDESITPLSMTDERLEDAIVETNARLVILDPIQAYVGSWVDMHRANEIRPVLSRLSSIAEKHDCAIILIGHMNKSHGKKSAYRGLGSIDFQAAARSVLIIGRLKDNSQIRILAHGKSSLAPEGESIAFELSEENGGVSQKEIWANASVKGISKRVLDQAKKSLEVKSKRKSNSWYWSLPKS